MIYVVRNVFLSLLHIFARYLEKPKLPLEAVSCAISAPNSRHTRKTQTSSASISCNTTHHCARKFP